MKDWKIAVIWTLVGFCMISVVIGVFNLFTFLQTQSINITTIAIEETTRKFYQSVTAAAVICAVTDIALIITTAILFAKNKASDKVKFIFVLLITILIISLFFIVFGFCTQYILKAEKFDAFSDRGSFYYNDYYHYQLYLSAVLSTFLPLLISGGIILGYLIYSRKAQNKEEISDKEEI